MARVLIIAIAVLLGAASVWFLVPTSAATVGGAPSSLPSSKDEVFSTSWFADKSPQAIERAMDECAIITNDELFVRHIMESADSSLTDTEEDLDVMAHLKEMRPTFKQLRNCINAKVADNGLFEAEG